jgi:hypothetical protein
VRQWPDIVGAELAELVQPVRFAHGALVLATDDNVLASDLRWRSSELATTVNEGLSTTAVERVDIVVRRPNAAGPKPV